MPKITRQTLCWIGTIGFVLGATAGCANNRAPDAALAEKIISEPQGGKHALQLLKEGNARFLAGDAHSPATDPETIRIAAVDGQKPFVSVLTCGDSRVPVERVFDRGFGEIFVVRVAGNVTAQHETGSIEFSLAALKAPLLVIMGHNKCGAIKAAIAGQPVTPNIDSFLASIQPAVQKVRAAQPNLTGDAFEEAVTQENVRQTLRELYATSPLIRDKVKSGAVEVAIAEIDITTGKVTWLSDVPQP
ncbi:MAG: carbonic anhydrase [Phycisphaerales bacterium]